MRDRIKYANCWEDADRLLTLNYPKAGSAILSIASGGDNALALLSTKPKILIAVDVNKAQLFLCELKAVAFAELSYEELINFLFGSSQANAYYEKIKNQLSPACKQFWNNHLQFIQQGVVHCGKFEQYFQFFRKYMMPWIHSKTTVTELLRNKSELEQATFYQQHWNTFTWKFLFRVFFSKFILGRFGRTKSYLDQVEVSVSEFIYKQAEHHLKQSACQTNYFLHYILTGKFEPQLPFYLRKENYQTIKENLQSLVFKHESIENYLQQENDIHYCNFSNIFEYMSKDSFNKFYQLLRKNLPHEAQINYWNLMVDRMFATSFPQTFSSVQTQSTEIDKGFFYKRFVSEIKHER